MKKIFALIFVFVLALCLFTACKEEGEIIKSDGFDSYDPTTGTLYATVDRETEVINLEERIAVTEGYTWKLFSDKKRTIEIDKKKVSLKLGENLFYFMMYDEGVAYAECILSIQRGADGIIEKADGFAFDKESGELKGHVNSDVGVIDLNAKIKVTDGYTWKLFSDEKCTNEVNKAKVSLNEGENVFYFMMYKDGEEYSKCVIKIQRGGIRIEENEGSLTGSIDIGELLN